MASPAPAALPVAAGAPGAGGSVGAEEALGNAAGRRRQPPVSALSAFSHIPARREGPPELSYFHREAKVREGRPWRGAWQGRAALEGEAFPVGFCAA